MNILFVLYHDFGANSAIHVHSFANHLAIFDHLVAVAIPGGQNLGVGLGEQQYRVQLFSEVTDDWSKLFPNAKPPDIVHAWTPRENVRIFCERLKGLCSFTLFIHLEDNEELILEANLGAPFEYLAATENIKVPPDLSHPRRYREFLSSAAAVTVIMDRLGEFVPDGRPQLELWPGADRSLFHPEPKDSATLEGLGIPLGNIILCYTGNVHSANAREVRSLYLAAAILNRQGIPTTLLRAGKDYSPFWGPDDSWARAISVDVGYIKHVSVPSILSLADYLIQPGMGDAFNDYRLPAKLPEFFAMGRPVVLPETNVGRFVEHGNDAWVLPKVDAQAIVQSVRFLNDNPATRQRLSAGALAFAERHFDWTKNSRQLAEFYTSVLTQEKTSLAT
jgi:glycosyltransferase involved in cell wall biosynthesis